jgi:hypothetical protein
MYTVVPPPSSMGECFWPTANGYAGRRVSGRVWDRRGLPVWEGCRLLPVGPTGA